jgi:drug/metabolite transporter (DMT)-like permease
MENRPSILTKPLVVCLLACFCCALWGSAYPGVKIGYALFSVDTGHVPSIILFAGLRFFLAGVLVVVFSSLAARRPLVPRRRRTWKHAAILCLFETVCQYFLFYVGLAHTSGVKASILGATGVFITLILAVTVYHQERMTGRKLLGCVLGFSGVLLVNLSPGSLGGGVHFMGEGFILLATVSAAFSGVSMKRFGAEDDPAVLSAWQFIIGGGIMVVVGLALGGQIGALTPAALAILLYLSALSGVAYTIWGNLLKNNPISRVTVFSFMTPVFGVVFSSLLLRESGNALGVSAVAALVLVCLGVYTVNSSPAAPTLTPPAPPCPAPVRAENRGERQ